MKLLGNIFKKKDEGDAPLQHTLLVDLVSLKTGRNGEFTPKTQLNLLRAVSQVTKQESWDALAFIEGEPLNKIGDGERFDERIPVHFFAERTALHHAILEQCSQASNPVVITNEASLYDAASSKGVSVMEGHTLRKAFDRAFGNARPRRSSAPRRKKAHQDDTKDTPPDNDLVDLV